MQQVNKEDIYKLINNKINQEWNSTWSSIESNCKLKNIKIMTLKFAMMNCNVF